MLSEPVLLDYSKRTGDKLQNVNADFDTEDESSDDEKGAVERRSRLKKLALEKEKQQNMLSTKEKGDLDEKNTEDENEDEASESESEYGSNNEYFSSDEDERVVCRLKPIFVRKSERTTIEPEFDEAKDALIKDEEYQQRRETAKDIVSNLIKEDMIEEQNAESFDQVVITDDDEDPEAEFQAWKLRELKRMKRDIEERQHRENETLELERLRNMNEEQRNDYFTKNPRFVTNAIKKTQYRFLQKYYHRGAFFLDKEEELFKQDFTQPTLEDHYDKSVLPAVLQVKNFGKAGRTKYTHLVDQDTTDFITNSGADNASIPEYSKTFHSKHGAGTKQIFNKPTFTRKRKFD